VWAGCETPTEKRTDRAVTVISQEANSPRHCFLVGDGGQLGLSCKAG
jgi:hypothetical protein